LTRLCLDFTGAGTFWTARHSSSIGRRRRIMSSSSALSVSGSCLCGSIQWNLDDNSSLSSPIMIGQILNCHCSQCRRISGSSSVPYVALPRQALIAAGLLLSSEESNNNIRTLTHYAASKVATRSFCATCGSFMCMDYHEPNTL
jgi:hypothetical protein